MHPDETTLHRHVDGELPPDESARIEELARGDAALARRLEELRTLKAAVLADAPALPSDFPDRVVAAAQARAGGARLDLDEARRFLTRALVAAAVLGGIGLTYLAIEVLPDLLAPPPLQARPDPSTDPGLLRR